MLLDERIYDLSIRGQRAQRVFLILPHEAAIAIHVGAEDGGKLALQCSPRDGANHSADTQLARSKQLVYFALYYRARKEIRIHLSP